MSLESFLTSEKLNLSESTPKPLRKKTNGKTSLKAPRIDMAADFETITDPNDCRVWSWGLVEIQNPEYDAVEIGLDIESFIERIKKHNATIYFHNFKFDGRFILDWLLNNGFRHIVADDLYENKTFKSLISDMGRFYSVTVRWDSGHTTEFRDSLNKLPMSLARVAKSFGMEETKGGIDYDAYRAPGHKLTAEEEDYLRRDVVILGKAMKEVIDSGMTRLTVASDSMKEFKTLTTSKMFEKLFPVLSLGIDSEIRRSYRGGFTYADERFKGKLQGGGIVLDVNSLYPSVMYNRILPYGEPVYARGKVAPTKTFPLVIFSVTFTAKLKPDHIPCIQVKGSSIFASTEYLREIKEPTTLMVTNVDWDLYNDHYDINVLAYGGGWMFKGAQGMFNTYIDKWSEIKANSEGGKREIAKLHLNSLYGKFASNPNVTSKIPVLEDGIVKLKRGEPETRRPVYTAAGVFITAYAREVTIRSAQVRYDTFAYADTDSLHLLQPDIPAELDVHPSKLGAWKFEYAFDNAFYIRPKAYLEHKSWGYDKSGNRVELDEYENHIAGLPEKVTRLLTFDDLEEGRILEGKLTPKAVPGGVVLKPMPFRLKLS